MKECVHCFCRDMCIDQSIEIDQMLVDHSIDMDRVYLSMKNANKSNRIYENFVDYCRQERHVFFREEIPIIERKQWFRIRRRIFLIISRNVMNYYFELFAHCRTIREVNSLKQDDFRALVARQTRAMPIH